MLAYELNYLKVTLFCRQLLNKLEAKLRNERKKNIYFILKGEFSFFTWVMKYRLSPHHGNVL
jgi:hypothetical protein